MLNTPIGQTLVSILLGIGLATMFREVCEGKNCIVFNGPVISEIDGKTYKYDDYCYKYELASVKCNPAKKIIETSRKDESSGVLDPIWGGNSPSDPLYDGVIQKRDSCFLSSNFRLSLYEGVWGGERSGTS